ncbi:MAG: hypothetical protein EBZ95_04885 [Chitinophagia bacterium]|nr:hypothetical protein [Chitinophagia bacterium]
MKELAILLKLMNVYAHNAHNLVEKSLFFQDHEYLNELYNAYDDAYDSVVERIIGLADSSAINLIEVNTIAAQTLHTLSPKEMENVAYFIKIEQMEQKLREHIQTLNPSVSVGTQQLIGGLADDSEKRSYKIKARIKK